MTRNTLPEVSDLRASQFVGDDRVALVDELVAAFDEVVADGGVRVHVLSAPSGLGKTRVVQELYARLAEAQPEPRYWPTELTDQSDWKQSRKLTHPIEVEVPPGAEIPWLWWGLSCQRRQSGVLHQALFEDIPQVVAHGASIDGRRSSGSSAQRAFDVSDAVVNIVSLAGVSTAAFLAGPLSIGGISMTAWWGARHLSDKVRSRQERRTKGRDGFVIDASLQGREDELAELARSVAKLSSQVPFVMVIDDAHWADTTLVSFLQHLAQNSASRVLVVATQWPQIDADTPWEGFRKNDATLVHDLVSLDDVAVRVLIRSEYQRIAGDGIPFDPAVADLVADRLGSSPMAIRALFGIERTRRLIDQGSLVEAETNWIPRDLKSLLSLYWEELPSEVQDVLAIAAVAGSRFPDVPVLEAAEAQGIKDAAGLLAQSHQPFGYVKPVSEITHWFTDPIFHDVAFEAAQDQLTPDEIAQVHEALGSFARSAEPEDPAAELAWAIHVELADLTYVDPSMAASSAVKLAKSALERFDFNTVVAMLDRAQAWSPEATHDDNLQARAVRVALLAYEGRFKEVIDKAESLLPELREALGSDHFDVLATRNNLATALGEVGRVEDAIAAFDRLWDDERRFLGSDDPKTFITRKNLAATLGAAGLIDDAIAALEQVLADECRVLGSDDRQSLLTRKELACWSGEAGRIDDAIAALEQVLADECRALGDDDRETLRTRNALALWLGKAGRIDDAISASEQLVADQRRVLGGDHRDTFTTRHNLANWLGEAGRVDDAIAAYKQLVADQRRVLGSDHRDTFTTRHNHALWLWKAHRFDDAVTASQQLFADQRRVLGDGDPLTRGTAKNLTALLELLPKDQE